MASSTPPPGAAASCRRPLFGGSSRLVLAVLVLVAVVVGTVAVQAAFVQLDPIRAFYGPDGSLRLRGTVSGQLLDYLQHGPRAANLTRYSLVSDGFPTAGFQAPASLPAGIAPPIQRWMGPAGLGPAPDLLRAVLVPLIEVPLNDVRAGLALLLGLLTLDAAAAGCTGTGNCYWYSGATGGTISWNTATDWWTGSGGTGTNGGLPGVDNVIFDASSVSVATTITLAGTVSNDAATLNNANVTVSTTASNYAVSWSALTLTAGTILWQGSSWQITGGVTVNGAGAVMSLATSSGVVYGAWTNASTSASWSAGTSSTVRFTQPGNTMTFGALSTEFFNVTFDATVLAVGGTYTMATNPLHFGGTLTVQNTAGSASGNVNLATSNLAIQGMSVTLGTYGQITAGSSTITLGGSWTSTNGTFTYGTSAVVIGGSNGTISNPSGFYALTVQTGGGTFTDTLGAALTVTAGLWVGNISSGTATLDLSASNYALTAGSITVGGSGSLIGRGSTITVNGNWDSSGGSFSRGTSTLVLAGSGTLVVAAGAGRGTGEVYNLTINSGVTATLSTNNLGVMNGLTVNGTLTGPLNVYISSSSAAPLVLGASYSLGNIAYLDFYISAATWSIPGLTATNATMFVEGNPSTTGTASMQGSVSVKGLSVSQNGGKFITLDTNSYNVTTSSGSLSVGTLGTQDGAVFLRTGTHTFGNAVQVNTAASYLDLGSSTVTVSGPWTNVSASASWNPGSGTVTFTSATSQTMTFAGSGLPVNEFNVVSFQSTASSGTVTFAMTGGALLVAGALTVQDSSGSTTLLTTSASNLGVSAASVTVGTGGSLTGNASTITVGGNWSSSAGTFTYGTSTLVFSGSGSLTTAASTGGTTLWSMTVNDTVTVTVASSIGVGGVLTMNTGTSGGLSAGGTLRDVYLKSGSLNPLVLNVGSNAAWCGNVSTVRLDFSPVGQSAYNVPGGSYQCNVSVRENASTALATLLGNLTTPFGLTIVPNTSTHFVILAAGAFNVSAASVVVGGGATPGTLLYGGALTFTSGSLTDTGIFSAYQETSYVQWGSGSHTIAGTYTDYSTDTTDWNAGTGTVSFAPAAVTSMTVLFGVSALGTPEFYNLTLVTQATYNVSVTLSSALWVANVLTLQGVNAYPGPGLLTFDVSTSNYTVTAGTIHIPAVALWYAREGRVVTSNWNAPVSAYQPTCFAASPPWACLSVAVVEFTGTGSIVSKNNPSGADFWNVQVDAGAVVSYGTVTTVFSNLTVSGKLNYSGSTPFTTVLFYVYGAGSGGNPLTLNVGSDLSTAGPFGVEYRGTDVSTWNMPGGVFEFLVVVGIQGTTANLTGDLTTLPCTTSPNDCEMLFDEYSGTLYNFTFYTNGHALTAGGELDIGDVKGFVFHAGSSTIVANSGLNFFERTVVYLENATITAHAYKLLHGPQALDIDYDQVTVYAGSALVNVHGTFTMGGHGGSALYAQTSTWNLYADEGATRTGSPNYCPGCVNVSYASSFIDFGSSTWSVYGNVYIASTSTSWSSGTEQAVLSLSGGTLSITSGGKSFPAVVLRQPGTVTVTDSLTVRSLSAVIYGVVVVIPAGGYLAVYGGAITGPGGAKLTLRSSVPGTQWILQAPDGTVASNVDVQDSNATGSVSACQASTDSGDNVNWTFSCAPSPIIYPPPDGNITFPDFGGFFGPPNPNLILEFGLLLLLVAAPLVAWRLLARRRGKGSGEGAIREGPSLRPRRGGRTISTAPRRARRRGE